MQDNAHEVDSCYISKALPDGNFTQVSSKLLSPKQCGLSPQACHLLSVLSSFPTDWKVNVPQLRKELKKGRDYVRRYLNELEGIGYIYRQETRDELGRMSGVETFVSQIIESSNSAVISSFYPGPCFPAPEKPGPEKPAPENKTYINNIYTNKHLTKKQTKKNVYIKNNNTVKSKVSELSLISSNVPIVQTEDATTISSFGEASNSFDLGVNSEDEYRCEGIDVLEPLSSLQVPSESISEIKFVVSEQNQSETVFIEAKEREQKRSFDSEFNEFWWAYPKKKEKQKAKEQYIKVLKKDQGMHEIIMDGLRKQNEERVVSEELGIWTPDPKWPAAWIKDARWEDETETREQLHERHIRHQQSVDKQYPIRETRYQRNSRLAARDIANANEQFRRALVDAGATEAEISAELHGFRDLWASI